MKKLALGVFALALAFSVTVASADASILSNLTVGSRGADVSTLQTALISGGYLTAVSAPTGYFGSATKAALAKWQAAKGISPAVGYFGPLSRAAFNGSAMTTGTTTTTTTGITTPGVEGTLTADQGAVSNTTVYEGQTSVPVLNIRLRAQTSDINVQRVQVNLGTSANVYAKAFQNLSVVGDDGKTLATVALNQNTVTKSGSSYYVTITGFNYLVAKNQYRYLTVNADVYGSVNDAYKGNYTFTLLDSGVRGDDGAGISQYTVGAFSQTVTIATSLTDSADLKLSTDSSTPSTGSVIANGGSLNNEADKVSVLVFNIKAEKDNIGVTDILASTTVNGVGKNASTTSAYLYDGSTLVASAAVQSNGTVAFNNISGVQGYVINKDTTKSFTLKVDLRNQSTAPGTLVATVLANGISAVNSQGVNINNITGSATSNNLYAQKSGPVYTLVGTPTLTKTGINNTASSTYLATFDFQVAAKGVEVVVGSSSAFAVGIFNGNNQVGSNISGTYNKPTSGITTNTNGDYVIADGNTASFEVLATFTGPAGVYTTGQIDAARIVSATTSSGAATYISDTFRTNSQAI